MLLVHDEEPKAYLETEEVFRCIKASTEFYETGRLYKIYILAHDHGDNKARRFVLGSDGLYDDISLTSSKFKKVSNGRNRTQAETGSA